MPFEGPLPLLPPPPSRSPLPEATPLWQDDDAAAGPPPRPGIPASSTRALDWAEDDASCSDSEPDNFADYKRAAGVGQRAYIWDRILTEVEYTKVNYSSSAVPSC